MNGSELLRFVVCEVTELCRQHPDWSSEQVARAYLPRAHAEFGGDSYYLGKHEPEARQAARDALLEDAGTATSQREVLQKHGVHRTTLYRLMKDRKA